MPGVGPRSAERIALWMVGARGDQPEQIARAITDTRQSIHSCNLCGFFAVDEICEICADPLRSTEMLCVTEQPTDILPLEKTGAFRGRYHALGGKISPLDHVAPEDLRIKELLDRVDAEKIAEIIFALPADVEGEATTNYIVDLVKSKPVALTRIARGIPAGGGLELDVSGRAPDVRIAVGSLRVIDTAAENEQLLLGQARREIPVVRPLP